MGISENSKFWLHLSVKMFLLLFVCFFFCFFGFGHIWTFWSCFTQWHIENMFLWNVFLREMYHVNVGSSTFNMENEKVSLFDFAASVTFSFLVLYSFFFFCVLFFLFGFDFNLFIRKLFFTQIFSSKDSQYLARYEQANMQKPAIPWYKKYFGDKCQLLEKWILENDYCFHAREQFPTSHHSFMMWRVCFYFECLYFLFCSFVYFFVCLCLFAFFFSSNLFYIHCFEKALSQLSNVQFQQFQKWWIKSKKNTKFEKENCLVSVNVRLVLRITLKMKVCFVQPKKKKKNKLFLKKIVNKIFV